MNRVWALLGWIALLPPALAQSTQPADYLLTHVPADTGLVVIVPSVDQLVQGLAAFGDAIGEQHLANLNTSKLLEQLDLLEDVRGLDLNRPLLLAESSLQSGPLILCHLKDAASWKDAAGAKEVGGGLLRVRVLGESGYAALQDDLLILAEDRDLVQAALHADGKFAARFRAHVEKLLTTQQIVVCVDVQAWQDTIEAALTAAKITLQMGLTMNSPPNETAAELVRSFVHQLVQIIRQTDTCVLGVQISAAGVSARTNLAFQPGGTVAAYLAKVHPSTDPPLRGLPSADAMFIMSCEWEVPPGTPSLNVCWLQALLDSNALKQKLGDAAHKKGMQAIIAMHDAMSGYNCIATTAPGTEGMLLTGLYFTADPPALLKNMCCAYEISSEFVNPFGTGSAMEVTARHERIAETDVQAFTMTFKTEDEQVRQMLQAMYGKTPTIFAMPRPNSVVFTMGSADAARAQMTKLLAGQAGKLADDPRVQAAAKALSPEPQACLYIDVAKFFDFMLHAARAAGAPVPPLLMLGEPRSAYVAIGGYLRPGQVRIELFVPAEPIRLLISRVKAVRGPEQGD